MVVAQFLVPRSSFWGAVRTSVTDADNGVPPAALLLVCPRAREIVFYVAYIDIGFEVAYIDVIQFEVAL